MINIGERRPFGGQQVWIRCAQCGKVLSITVYPGERAESEMREEAWDEGWREVAGKWYCNECDDREEGVGG